MELTGKIHEIGEEEFINDKLFKREIILDISRFDQLTGERWENYALFQILNNRVSVDGFEIGDIVKVSFCVNGRFYQRKDDSGQGFFQNLACMKIEHINRKHNETNDVQSNQANSTQPVASGAEGEDDDLPF